MHSASDAKVFQASRLVGLARRAHRPGLSIVDQLGQSLVTALTAAVIGNQLGLAALGVYGLLHALVRYSFVLNKGLLLDSVSVFGPRHLQQDRPRYLGFLLLSEILLGLTLGGLVALAAGLLSGLGYLQPATGWATAATAVHIFAWTLLALGRRIHYARHQVGRAALQTMMYGLLALGGMGALIFHGMISLATIYLILAAASLAAFAVGMGTDLLNVHWPAKEELRRYGREAWQFGRWLVATSPMDWLKEQGHILLSTLLLGTVEAGIVKACDVVVRPFSQVVTGLTNFYLPRASARFENGTYLDQRRWAVPLVGSALALAALFYVAMLVLGVPLLAVLFQPEMAQHGLLVALMALQVFGSALRFTAAIVLMANHRSARLFWDNLIGNVGCLAVSLLLIQLLGIHGAGISFALITMSIGLLNWWSVWRLWHTAVGSTSRRASAPSAVVQTSAADAAVR